MKQIYYIMKAELQALFYSPVAWLILVVFTLQCAVAFCDTLDQVTKAAAEGMQLPGLTAWFYGRDLQGLGVFTAGMRYLYIYFPLLTMGLISKEIANGSIKLLNSSPVSSSQIVMGKYLAVIVYSLILLAIMMTFAIIGMTSIAHFNYPLLWVMVIGSILTMATYAAIGLFMSSLTRYPVVAAIGSFVAFFVLERVGDYGQSWPVIRDITAWLSFAGRTGKFIEGFLTSQNVIYLLGITLLFISFTILRLWLSHFHYKWWQQAGYYTAILLAILLVGIITSRPSFRLYCDATENQIHTIKPESQQIMKALRDKGPLTITTYVNLMDRYRTIALPANVTKDKADFDKYVRFKPDIRFKYVYYYAHSDLPDNQTRLKPGLTFEEQAREMARLNRVNFNLFMPKTEIDKIVDLAPEHYRFVRFFELEDGTRSVLRVYDDIPPLPMEKEYMVAFKRLLGNIPRVGVITGHGERSIHDAGNLGYQQVASSIFNRYSWTNQGIDPVELTLENDIPADLDILLVADPRAPYSDNELQHLDNYLARGGNLILLLEPDRRHITRPLLDRLGLELLPGCLAQKPSIELPYIVETTMSQQAIALFPPASFSFGTAAVAMNGVAALQWKNNVGYTVIPFMVTPSSTWNKIGTVDWLMGPIEPDSTKGEQTGTFATALALTRQVGDKEQRVFVSGDADWMDNRELKGGRQGFRVHSPARLNDFLSEWITYGKAPLRLTYLPVTDTRITLTQSNADTIRWCLAWGFPLLLVAAGSVTCIRRNRH